MNSPEGAPSGDDTLEELLAQFIELEERGEAPSIDEFLQAHPARADALRTMLRRFARVDAALPDEEATLRNVGPWRIVGPLGSGGMGRVFRVRRSEESDEGEYALKLLGPGLGLDPRAVARIHREGTLLRQVAHPGVVQVIDVGESALGPWIVMQLVEGETLAKHVSRAVSGTHSGEPRPAWHPGPLVAEPHQAWVALARFGAALADAMAAAHAQGVLHRDLKPSNVMLRADDAPVVIDFGLAVAEGSRSLTRTGDLVGTPQYMAPEQARGERADARTDVWGLAAVLHALSTGSAPTPVAEPLAALEHVRRRRPRRLERRSSGVPAELARVLDRALAHRRSRRTPTMEALREDLVRFAAGQPPAARSASLFERLEDAWRVRPLAWTAAVTALLAVGGALALRREPTPDPHALELARLDARHAAREDATRAWLAGDSSAMRDAGERLVAVHDEGRGALVLALADAGPWPISGSFADDSAHIESLIRGAQALKADDPVAAAAAFEVAALEVDGWSLPLVLYGDALNAAGNVSGAEREWTSAARIADDSPALHERIGRARGTLGDLEGAARARARAAELAPDDWRHAFEHARALAKLGDETSKLTAVREIERALAIGPRPPQPAALNVQAALLSGLGRRDEARAIYRSLVARDPGHLNSWFNLAYAHDLDCQLTDARVAYRRVLELRPNHVNAHVALAKIANGSEQATCARCAAAVAADPGLVDPEEVVTRVVAALRADDGRTPWLPQTAVDYVLLAGRGRELEPVLQELARSRPEVDEATVRLERALRDLRERLE